MALWLFGTYLASSGCLEGELVVLAARLQFDPWQGARWPILEQKHPGQQEARGMASCFASAGMYAARGCPKECRELQRHLGLNSCLVDVFGAVTGPDGLMIKVFVKVSPKLRNYHWHTPQVGPLVSASASGSTGRKRHTLLPLVSQPCIGLFLFANLEPDHSLKCYSSR